MLQKIHTYGFRHVVWVGLVVLLLGLQGCAQMWVSPQKLVGQPEQQVLDTWGQPTARVLLPQGGVRLQYSGQPWGRYVWMVNLNAAAQVEQVYQVLQLAAFNQIPVDGSWGHEDVLREFGPPAFIDHVASWKGDIWNYRWVDNTQDMYYYIYMDESGKVRRAHAGIDDSKDRYDWIR